MEDVLYYQANWIKHSFADCPDIQDTLWLPLRSLGAWKWPPILGDSRMGVRESASYIQSLEGEHPVDMSRYKEV